MPRKPSETITGRVLWTVTLAALILVGWVGYAIGKALGWDE